MAMAQSLTVSTPWDTTMSLTTAETSQLRSIVPASNAAALGLILSFPKIFINELDVAVIHQQRWLEENGQRLDNVD